MDIQACLPTFPLFSKLSPGELEILYRRSKDSLKQEGEYVYHQGDTGDHFYVLLEGEVDLIIKREDNNAAVVGRIGSGGHFGESSLLSDQPRSLSVRCATPVTLLCIPGDIFQKVLVANPAFLLQLNKILAARLRLAFREQIDIIFDSRHPLSQENKSLSGQSLPRDQQVPSSRSSKQGAAPTTLSAKEINEKIQLFARNLEPLLIIGSHGTGRRLVANQVHLNSSYRQGPYIELDVSQFEAGLWEGKLFGHEHDAFPFSQVRHTGILEQFRGGTVVLYHAESLNIGVQQQLCKALTDGEFHRVKGKNSIRMDARLIFVCRNDELPQQGSSLFIPELEKILSPRKLSIPPLCEHKRDIPRLVNFYLEHFNREYGRNIQNVSSNALGVLMNYDWPGNLTELGNVIQRAVLLAEKDEILSEQILLGLPQPEGKREYNLLRWPFIKKLATSPLYPFLPRLLVTILFIGGLGILLFGPQDPGKNIGLVMSWAIGWPLMLFSFFFLGRVWCSVCTLSLPGNLAQKIIKPKRAVPDFIAQYSGWIMALSCIAIFWIELVWDAYQNARLTGAIVLAIMLGSLVFSMFFKRKAWCRYVCPLGGLNAIFAMPSVMELRANRHFCVNTCREHTCYKGDEKHEGCPMSRHPFLVDNNRDCTLCANCIKNCPHNSIQLNLRIAPQELWLIQNPRAADSFLIVSLAAIYFPLARHQQFTAFMEIYSPSYFMGSLLMFALILCSLGLYSCFLYVQTKLSRRTFTDLFKATGYGCIPLVLGAFLAVYFEMFITGLSQLVSLLPIPLLKDSGEAGYRLFQPEATATLQQLIIAGGLLAAFYATYRIVQRYTRTTSFSMRLYSLPYAYLLLMGFFFWYAL